MIAVPLLATFSSMAHSPPHDVLMTRQALVGYSVGLIGMILVKILAPGFTRARTSDTCKDRHRHVAGDAGDERAVHRLDTACRVGIIDRPGAC